MELSVRDWMVIVGILLILAVLFDGFRRVRNERRGKIRMSLNKQFANNDDESNDDISPELPNGGARVVSRRAPFADKDNKDGVTGNPDSVSAVAQDDVDIDLDDLSLHTDRAPIGDPLFDDVPVADHDVKRQYGSNEIDLNDNVIELDDSVAAPLDGIDDNEINLDDYEESSAELKDDPLFEGYDVPPAKSSNPVFHNPEEKEFIRVNVKTRGEDFSVAELTQILNACDCKIGDLNIFHRHEFANQQGAIQFSVANMVEPGHFASKAVEHQSTPGISFFMAIPGPQKPLEAFDCMVETAKYISLKLEGEMQDETRSVMTAQTLEHHRQNIIEMERKRLMSRS